MPSRPNDSQRVETLMASLTRTISIKFPSTPEELAKLRKQCGLSDGPRRQRATPDRGFLTFGHKTPAECRMPYQGDIS